MGYYSAIMNDVAGYGAYYRCGELSGSTANDSTTLYNATLNGTITKNVAGAVNDSNGAMTLDGSTGYIGVPIGLDLSGSSTFSLEAWVKLPVASNGTGYRLMANAHTDIDNTGYQVAIGTSGFFNLKTVAGFQLLNFVGVTWNTNQWIYVACVYDGSFAYVYINGALNATSASITGTLVTSTNPTNIGRNPAYAGDYLPGSIDECVILKNKALSADQIRHHYRESLAQFSAPKHKSFRHKTGRIF